MHSTPSTCQTNEPNGCITQISMKPADPPALICNKLSFHAGIGFVIASSVYVCVCVYVFFLFCLDYKVFVLL